MRVCVPRKITYGWNNYTGLTYYRPFTIKRVTPKKTKVVCEDGTEFFTKETVFLTPVHEMNIENERANLFQKMGATLRHRLERKRIEESVRRYVAGRDTLGLPAKTWR